MQNQSYENRNLQLELGRNYTLVPIIYKIRVPEEYRAFHNHIFTNKPIDSINLTEIYFLVPYLEFVIDIGWKVSIGNCSKLFLIIEYGYEMACILSLQQIYTWINESGLCYNIGSTTIQNTNTKDDLSQLSYANNNPLQVEFTNSDYPIYSNTINYNYELPYILNTQPQMSSLNNDMFNLGNKMDLKEVQKVPCIQHNKDSNDSKISCYFKYPDTFNIVTASNDPHLYYQVEQGPIYKLAESNQINNNNNSYTNFMDPKLEFYPYENTLDKIPNRKLQTDEIDKDFGTNVNSKSGNFNPKKNKSIRGKKLSFNDQAPPRGVRLEKKKERIQSPNN